MIPPLYLKALFGRSPSRQGQQVMIFSQQTEVKISLITENGFLCLSNKKIKTHGSALERVGCH